MLFHVPFGFHVESNSIPFHVPNGLAEMERGIWNLNGQKRYKFIMEKQEIQKKFTKICEKVIVSNKDPQTRGTFYVFVAFAAYCRLKLKFLSS